MCLQKDLVRRLPQETRLLTMMAEETKSKKQRNGECIINRLPGDLIERIFFKLPVSTLLRCTGVCEQWHKIIRDPQFVTSHLQDAPQCAFLFFPQESVSGEPHPADAILIDETWSQSTCAVPVVGPGDSLCGSCNGLLCLYTKSSTLKIASAQVLNSGRLRGVVGRNMNLK